MPTLVALLAIAAAFILLSGQSLPRVVASHFAAGGHADGFMPRNAYLGLAAREPGRFRIIDATASEGEVAVSVRRAIDAAFPPAGS